MPRFSRFILPPLTAALALGAASATRPITATGPTTAPARDPRDLSTVEGITLIRVARTQEEVEEQQGGPEMSEFSSSTSFFGKSTIRASGQPAALLRDISKQRVFFDGAALPEESYILQVSAPRASLLPNLCKAYEQAFHVHIASGEREVDVLVLTGDAEKLKALAKAPLTPDFYRVDDSKSRYVPLMGRPETVATSLERELHAPVVDETNFTGIVRVNLLYSPKTQREDITASLAKTGLALTPAKRKLKGLFIEKPLAASQPATAPAAKSSSPAPLPR